MILDDTELCFGELAYENRLVAFFDILGWRNEISRAGTDPRHIARLASALRMFNANAGAVGDAGARLTTFSDNVVFSKPFVAGDVNWLLQGLATTQLGLAVHGFWLRGAVTVGALHHDHQIVFGPALNHAYELESNVSLFPRILLDTAALEPPKGTDFVADEAGEVFLDPFTPRFWDRIQTDHPIRRETIDGFNELTGATFPHAEQKVSGGFALSSVANRLSLELTTTDIPAVWTKLSWLFDRVVSSLGGRTTADMLPKSPQLMAALARTTDD
jgi:hypothetical protein